MSAEEHWDAAQEAAERIAEGDPEGALPLLEALVVEQPDNEYAYFFLGSAHYELASYHKALAAYVKALELAPEYVGAMVNAGHCLRLLGRHQHAIRMGKQVLERSADDPDAFFLLGATHFAHGDNAAAQQYLTKFLETNPELEVATEAEGMLQVIRGEVVEAMPEDEPD